MTITEQDADLKTSLNLREALEWAKYEGWTRAMLELRESYPEAAQALHLAWLRDHPPVIAYPERPWR